MRIAASRSHPTAAPAATTSAPEHGTADRPCYSGTSDGPAPGDGLGGRHLMLDWDGNAVVIGDVVFRSSLFSGLHSSDKRFFVWKTRPMIDQLPTRSNG
jgi:hypothetical protein